MPRGKQKRGAKAEAIRAAFDELGVNTAPKDVIAKLAEGGIKVAPAQVSNIRTKLLGKAGRPGPRGRRAGRVMTNGLTVSQLFEIKKLVDSVGGADHMRQALDALAQLGHS
ncbi:MAG: hypothetical protein K1X74_16360 [Pirellulales bacterium]|nr:hypothetical protein [Pirellulales bacterium]